MVAAAVLAMTACSTPEGSHVVATDHPDGRPAVPDAPSHPDRRSCEAGTPPCEQGTECVNFGDFGGTVCAQFCAQDSDCADGLICVPDASNRGVCATSDWGPPDGILPELLCRDENSCGYWFDDDEQGCRDFENGCLTKLTSAQRATWANEVEDCATTYTNCAQFFSCIQNTVSGCW